MARHTVKRVMYRHVRTGRVVCVASEVVGLDYAFERALSSERRPRLISETALRAIETRERERRARQRRPDLGAFLHWLDQRCGVHAFSTNRQPNH